MAEIHIPCRMKLPDHGSTVDWHVGHCCSGIDRPLDSLRLILKREAVDSDAPVSCVHH